MLIIVFVSRGWGGEGVLGKRGMSDVFFAEPLEFVKCTMKNRSLASIKMQHLHACSSLMCSLHPLGWASGPESMRYFFNQFIYAGRAAKKHFKIKTTKNKTSEA